MNDALEARQPAQSVRPSPASADLIVDVLAGLRIFSSAPREELAWIASRGALRTFAAGAAIIEFGATVDEMFVLLAGHVAVYAASPGGRRMLLDLPSGQIVGAIPYSRMRVAPASVVAEEETQTLALNCALFPDLLRECPEVTAALVHFMIDRARMFYGAQLNEDRLQSLGRLASGLAHELNNPASAATRGAHSLARQLRAAEDASVELAAARLNAAQIQNVIAIRQDCDRPTQARGAIEAADREDDLVDWLTRRGMDPALAAPLASCDLDLAALDRLTTGLPTESVGPVIRWLAGCIAARDLAQEIALATGRIHDLVSAVKGFTFMDREAVPDEVDVARGLADTVAVLQSKAQEKSVDLRIEVAADLPRVYGYGSEINQAWEKLVDNALDAVGVRGKVTITATSRDDLIVVRVADDGPGVPENHRTRIFDPFFTTKPVGSGTGLGLDIARRAIQVHHGDIDFTSQPGHTVFRVRLPVRGVRKAE
jgi:signal transduction histidine kinase